MGRFRAWMNPRPRLRDIDTDWNGPEFEPIAGISFQQFVEITRGMQGAVLVAPAAGSAAAVDALVEQHGISKADWLQAVAGWEHRLTTTRSLQIAMSKLYLGWASNEQPHPGDRRLR